MTLKHTFDASMLKTPEIDQLRNLSDTTSDTIGKSFDKNTKLFSNRHIIDTEQRNESCHKTKETLKTNIKKTKKHTSKKSSKSHDLIGPWKLGKTLGKGSSGRVRLAKNKITGQMAAVKIVNKTKNKKSNFGHGSSNNSKGVVFEEGLVPYGIEREIIIMKLVAHPNIMSLFEVWENKSELYLIMEYVDGGELFDVLVNNGKLPEHEAVYYFKQIIQGVSYLHRFNICHRDLKPENILLDKKNHKIKIADFGMAALELSDTLLTTSCGSPHYASPEIIKGMKYNGSPSDVWSCGVILYALLAGYLPFNDSNIKTLLEKVQKGKYDFPEHFSVESRDLIDSMLKVNPNDRVLINEIETHPLMKKYNRTSKDKSNTNIKSLLKEKQIYHVKERHRYPTMPKDMDKIVLKDESSVDQDILNSLQILWHGVSKDKIIKSLLNNEQNEEKFFYSLLEEYQKNQHKTSNTEKQNEPEIERIVVDLPEDDNAFENAPLLNAVSRFSSFMSLHKSQFFTKKDLLNYSEKDNLILEELSIDEPKPGLGIYLDNAFNNDCEKNDSKSLYALNSISKRSLHLSNFLTDNHGELGNDKHEVPLPITPLNHRNEFSRICENLLFEDENKIDDTVVQNTFVKMSLDPKLKQKTLKNLSNLLKKEKRALNNKSTTENKANTLSTTSTFQDLKHLLSSINVYEDVCDEEKLTTSNETLLKNEETQYIEPCDELQKPNNGLRPLPTTRSFLFADLESTMSSQKLSLHESDESEGPLIAKRIVAATENNELVGNNSSIGKDLKMSAEGKLSSLNNGNDNLDFRGSLYITNDSDLNKSSLGEIKRSFVGVDTNLLQSNEQKVLPQRPGVFDGDKMDNFNFDKNVQHNRDSRLIEISLGDITNENLNEISNDDEFKTEKIPELTCETPNDMRNNEDNGNNRVTMLFDENEKKFFEDLISSKEGEKSRNLNDFRNSLKSSIKGDITIPKIRDSQGLHKRKVSQKNDNSNWFTRLVSRISSGSGSSTTTKINSRLSSFLKEDGAKLKSKNDEESVQPTVILHERLFNCSNEYKLQTVNRLMVSELDTLTKSNNMLNYRVEEDIGNVVIYSINFDIDNNKKKLDSIRLSIEKCPENNNVTLSLSQMRDISDNNSKKITLFNDLSTKILRKF
ncbi:hypothetical protein ACO0R3_001464 [Hanseniaspora guilliermondii]